MRRLDKSRWSVEDETAFQLWLGESPENAAEFQNAEAVLHSMSCIEAFGATKVERIIEKWKAPAPKTITAGPWLIRFAAAAAVILLVTLFWPGQNTYSTGPGERAEVVLPDGSIVLLDARTRLECHFTRAARRIRLVNGAALFTVAPDGDRPFSVETSDCVIRDIGTTFSVQKRTRLDGFDDQPESVEVAVAEGVVEVRPRSAKPGGAVRITAGHFAVWSGENLAAEVAEFSMDAFATWREDRLRYRNRPLVEVLGDLQRYFHGRIELADPSLAELQVTGTLRTDDLDEALTVLRKILPLRVREFPAGRLVIERDPHRNPESPR